MAQMRRRKSQDGEATQIDEAIGRKKQEENEKREGCSGSRTKKLRTEKGGTARTSGTGCAAVFKLSTGAASRMFILRVGDAVVRYQSKNFRRRICTSSKGRKQLSKSNLKSTRLTNKYMTITRSFVPTTISAVIFSWHLESRTLQRRFERPCRDLYYTVVRRLVYARKRDNEVR